MANWRGKGGSSGRYPLLGSKSTADGDCSHVIKRWLLLGRKAVTNIDSALKGRDITLQTKVHIVKARVFWGFPGSSASKESACNRGELFNPWVKKICWRRDRPPTPVFLGSHGGLAGIESPCNVGDLGSIPVLGRSPGERNSYPLQCSGLENSIECRVHGVAKSETGLSHFHFTSFDGSSSHVQMWELGHKEGRAPKNWCFFEL